MHRRERIAKGAARTGKTGILAALAATKVLVAAANRAVPFVEQNNWRTSIIGCVMDRRARSNVVEVIRSINAIGMDGWAVFFRFLAIIIYGGWMSTVVDTVALREYAYSYGRCAFLRPPLGMRQRRILFVHPSVCNERVLNIFHQ